MALSCVSRSPDIILIGLLYFTYKQSRNTTRLSIFYDIVTSLKYITAHILALSNSYDLLTFTEALFFSFFFRISVFFAILSERFGLFFFFFLFFDRNRSSIHVQTCTYTYDVERRNSAR